MSISGLRCVESCLSCRLRSRNFFCDLSPASLEAFNKIKHAAVFPEHTVVLVEGQSPCGIFILCQGRAKLSTTSRDGKTLIVRVAEPGEVLGLHAVITGGPYELTVETMQPCQLNYVGREDMLRFLKEHPDACLHAIQHLARDSSDAYGVVRAIGLSHSVSERFARFLLDTAADGEIKNGTVHVRLLARHRRRWRDQKRNCARPPGDDPRRNLTTGRHQPRNHHPPAHRVQEELDGRTPGFDVDYP